MRMSLTPFSESGAFIKLNKSAKALVSEALLSARAYAQVVR